MGGTPDILFFFSLNEIAQLCEVSLKTAKRWKAGQSVPPPTALMVLRRDLGCFHPAWKGWQIREGTLYSPEGWAASPGDVLSIQFTQSQLATYRSENRALKDVISMLEASGIAEEQPLPDQWEIAAG